MKVHADLNRTAIILVSAIALSGGLVACQTGSETTSTTETTGGGETAVTPVVAADLNAILAGDHRSEKNRARDEFRHPKETLAFFGITPDMTVIELSPGGGWYTEILAPYLKAEGKLIAAPPGEAGERAKYLERFKTFVQSRPDLYGDIELVVLDPPTIDLGAPGQADAVLTFRNTHNWAQSGAEAAVYKAAFDALKPGGVFGVVQHRAAEGTDVSETAGKGYVTEAHVIETATAAGFVLEESSEINANPKDTKDYEAGVWALPPVLRGGEETAAQFEAIGESDRMTLRFRKPTGSATE